MADHPCMKIKGRENRRRNQEWTIQRQWKHWARTTQDGDKSSKKQDKQTNI